MFNIRAGILTAMGIGGILLPLTSNASRTLTVPSLALTTVHGGAMVGTPPSVTCTSADMQNGSTYLNGSTNGVKVAIHRYHLSLSNLSRTLAQSVQIQIGVGSGANSKNSIKSDGTQDTVPSSTGPELLLTATKTSVINVPANGNATYELTMACSSLACVINDTFGALSGNATILSTPSTQPDNVCIELNSALNLTLVVTPDQGAINAYLYVEGHRAYGSVDHYLSTPPSFMLNGGRPF